MKIKLFAHAPQQEARESGYTGYDPTKAIEKKKVRHRYLNWIEGLHNKRCSSYIIEAGNDFFLEIGNPRDCLFKIKIAVL